MDLNVFASGPNFHYQADVHFTDWSGIDEWNSFFKTDEGIKFGKKVYALAEAINREILKYNRLLNYRYMTLKVILDIP